MTLITKTFLALFFFIPTFVFGADVTYNNPTFDGDPIGWVNWNSTSRTEVATAFCESNSSTYVSHTNDGISGPTASYAIRNYNNTEWENNNWKNDGYTQVTCDDGSTVVTPPSGNGTSTTIVADLSIINNSAIILVWLATFLATTSTLLVFLKRK